MLAYGAFGSCACACQYSPSTLTSAKAPNAIILTIFWFIDASLELKRSYILEYSAMLLRKSKSPAGQTGQNCQSARYLSSAHHNTSYLPATFRCISIDIRTHVIDA